MAQNIYRTHCQFLIDIFQTIRINPPIVIIDERYVSTFRSSDSDIARLRSLVFSRFILLYVD